MNAAGIASAFVFLIAVSAVRLGDKPTFSSEAMEEAFTKQIEDERPKRKNISRLGLTDRAMGHYDAKKMSPQYRKNHEVATTQWGRDV